MTGEKKAFITGSKTFEITDYSLIKKGIENKSCIKSDPFKVGDHSWVIEFYPQGFDASHVDSISILVRLLNPPKPVQAFYSNRLKDWTTSTWSTDTPTSSSLSTFAPSGNTAWGSFDFITHSKLKTSNYLKDDTLVIKTTIWVVKD